MYIQDTIESQVFRNKRNKNRKHFARLIKTGYSVLSIAGRSIWRGFRLLVIVCMYTTFDNRSLDRLGRQIELFEVGDPNLKERGCTRLCATFATTNSVATVFGRYSVNNQPRRSTRRRATQRNNSIPAFPVPSHFASSRLSTLRSVSFIGHTQRPTKRIIVTFESRLNHVTNDITFSVSISVSLGKKKKRKKKNADTK